MKSNWIGNPALQALVRSGEAVLRPEIVAITDSSLKDLKSEWEAGTASGAGTAEYLDSGVRIEAAPATAVPATANDGSDDIIALTPIPTSDVVVVEWIGAPPEKEVYNLVARLDPRADGGQPKTVSVFRAQLSRLDVWVEVPGSSAMMPQPISGWAEVAASGEIAANFTFSFRDLGLGAEGGYPKIGFPATRRREGELDDIPVTVYPAMMIQIIALKDTGEVADNVTWLSDAGQQSVTDGTTYIATYKQIEAAPDDEYRLLVTPAANVFPEFTLNASEYADPVIITFSGAQDIDDLTGSGDVAVVARGEAPGDSEITYEISDDAGANWFECFDGDLLATDNTAEGGGNLTSVSATGPWALRVTLTPSTNSLNTPVVRTFGVEAPTSTWLTGAAELSGGLRTTDPQTLIGNIASAELLIAKTGEPDFRDYGSNILAANHIGAISVRIWVADVPDSGQLVRHEWMLDSVWEIDNYTSTDTHHRLSLISPLRRLRNVIIPPFVVSSGNNGTRTATEVTGTLKACYEEILDDMVALPARFRGPGVEDATNTAAKLLKRSEGKEELDRIAYLAGGSVIESQGRVKFVRVVRDGPGADTPVASFPLGSYTPGDFGPGYDTRTDEFFVPYEWNEGTQEFDSELRYFTSAGIANLGGVGINTTQELDAETAKWITGATLADLVGERVPHHFATGLILWPIVSHIPHPELEIGDCVTIETTRFVGRHPVNSSEVRGRLFALGIIVEVGKWGRELTIWVPSFDQIVPATGTVTRYNFIPAPGTVLHIDATTRSHTGNTTLTVKESFPVPALYQQGKQYAVRCEAFFASSGALNTKGVGVGWSDGSAGVGRTVTLATGDQAQRIQITVQPSGAATAIASFDHPELAGFSGSLTNPCDADGPGVIEFTVQLANGADSVSLLMSQVTWLGEVV